MSKIPQELRQNIANNIRACRIRKFPGRGGARRCAEAFGVLPQQWSPWETGKRMPDESRLLRLADFFGVTVEYLRRDNSVIAFLPPMHRPSIAVGAVAKPQREMPKAEKPGSMESFYQLFEWFFSTLLNEGLTINYAAAEPGMEEVEKQSKVSD